MPRPRSSPARPADWSIDEWVCTPVFDSNKPYYWEVAYCLPQLDDDDDYGISFTLYCETSRDGEDTQHGCWVWTGSSLAEIEDQITMSFSGSNDDLAAEEFEWFPSEEIIRTVPELDAQHTALLYSWFRQGSLLKAIEVCEELQGQGVGLEPHHETLLKEAVFDSGSPPREAVEMIASLRQAEGLD